MLSLRFMRQILLVLTFVCVFPPAIWAAPSCELENWLGDIDERANAYALAIDTGHERDAARDFRHEIERYKRDQIVDQIHAADLGANENALFNYLSSRHYLLDLHNKNWPKMARRYSNDPRFEKQSQSLITFLTATACDPHQTDFLTPIERSGTVERITETFKEHEAESAPPPEPTEFSFDPDNFDDAINGSEPAQKTPRISEAHTSNVAFILGVFTFISATFAWGWMRLGIVKRRRIRYPCVLPTLLFDGIELVQAEARDISQLGMKLDCSHAFTPNQRIKVTIGPVETVAKIAWQNNHFIGVGFEQAISEIDMNHILGPYATDVANNAQEPRPAPIHDMPEFNEVDV